MTPETHGSSGVSAPDQASKHPSASVDGPTERTYSTHEAAKLLGVSPQTVRDRIAVGRLNAWRDPVSRRARVPESELRRLQALPNASAAVRMGALGELAGAFGEELASCIQAATAEAFRANVDVIATAVAGTHHGDVLAWLREAHEERDVLRQALRELATARRWKRRALLRRLRVRNLL